MSNRPTLNELLHQVGTRLRTVNMNHDATIIATSYSADQLHLTDIQKNQLNANLSSLLLARDPFSFPYRFEATFASLRCIIRRKTAKCDSMLATLMASLLSTCDPQIAVDAVQQMRNDIVTAKEEVAVATRLLQDIKMLMNMRQGVVSEC